MLQLTLKSKRPTADRVTFGNGDGIPRSYEPQVTKWKKNNSLTVLNQDENGIFTIGGLKCKGEINFVEDINVPSIGDIQVPPKNFVQPPSDLHWRHPFFGRNTTNTNPVINSTLVEENVNPEHKPPKRKKNKKDKKHHIIDEVSLEDGILKKIKIEPSVTKDQMPNIDEVRLEDSVLKKIKKEQCVPEKKKKHKRKREES